MKTQSARSVPAELKVSHERMKLAVLNPTEIFGSSDSRGGRVVSDMATRRVSPQRTGYVLTGFVISVIILAFLVLPVVILWVGTYGGRSTLNLSMLTFGIISMLPAILLGVTSVLVMLGCA